MAKELTTTQRRADAIAYPTAFDAHVGRLEYLSVHRETDFSIRHYPAEGFYVLVIDEDGGTSWLTREG